MRKKPAIWRKAAHIASIPVYLAIALTIAYYLTSLVYDRAGWHPPALAAQIVNTLLGLCLLVLAVLIPRFFVRGHRDPFAPIIDAMQQIAKGNFSTRVDNFNETGGPVGQLVQTVNVMAGKLDEMEQMRQEFVSDVSHEIQSPLTSIRGFASALLDDHLSAAERRRYLNIIEAESVRLSRLSANLLKLASLESNQVRFEPKRYRLDTQLRSLILACEPQWTEKHLEMDAALDEAAIIADEDLLGQVWINLLHNSIKFTPAGGSIRVSLQQRGDMLQASIADTGTGIAAEDQPHIFERFYKADKARRGSEGGSGLGLSIARKAVELHRGSITVRSQPGAGATFVVELPAGDPAI